MDQRQGPLSADAKQALRTALRARRESLPPPDREALGRRITYALFALPEYGRARWVLAYMSIGAEFDTRPFVRQVLLDGKVLVLPRVNCDERCLDLFTVRDLLADLAPGVWSIHEPVSARCKPAAVETIDFALVPGLGFDTRGGRLGYGGGFYDRLLSRLPSTALRVAAAFSVQLLDAVPTEPHDQYVNLIVTEDGPLRARR